MANNAPYTELDANQVLTHGYEEIKDQHRVKINEIDPSVVLPIISGGLSVLGSFNIPFGSISHSTPYQITAGFGSPVQSILVADTTGQTDKILIGAGNTLLFYTNPGCERAYNVAIASGTAIKIQSAESSDPTAGSYIITFLG